MTELETVNNYTEVNDKKLSKLQKAILRHLVDTSKFWGLPINYLSWEIARELEPRPGVYIENRKDWRRRRREEESKRFREGEISREDFNIMLYFLRDSPRKKEETLTAKWRSSFSRALKRLKNRGFIDKIVEMRIEEREGKSFWVSYTGNGRTKRVVLEPQGRKWIEDNKEALDILEEKVNG